MNTISIDGRALNTVLAALRFYQSRLGSIPLPFEEIADAMGPDYTPLDDGEIDTLCEQINCAGSFPPADQIPKDPVDYVCPECGSDELHFSAWEDARTGLNTGDEGPVSYSYCTRCDEVMNYLVRRSEYDYDNGCEKGTRGNRS